MMLKTRFQKDIVNWYKRYYKCGFFGPDNMELILKVAKENKGPIKGYKIYKSERALVILSSYFIPGPSVTDIFKASGTMTYKIRKNAYLTISYNYENKRDIENLPLYLKGRYYWKW